MKLEDFLVFRIVLKLLVMGYPRKYFTLDHPLLKFWEIYNDLGHYLSKLSFASLCTDVPSSLRKKSGEETSKSRWNNPKTAKNAKKTP